ncbi:MAG: putative baseplate assembly protein [Anaerolineaceae bacterium 4572_78]|nr:MAG: putative baseplate assembly protein [Anaerolineaceae bacterium 4572_78]
MPKGTEIATRVLTDEPEIIFTTDKDLTVIPARLTQVRRIQDFHRNYLPRLQKHIEVFEPFDNDKPQIGDTFYLGFDMEQNIRGHILALSFRVMAEKGTGIRPEDPPLVWECSLGNGKWKELFPSQRSGEKDTTRGFNNEQGMIAFILPLDLEPDDVLGRIAFWIRCRFEPRDKRQGMYDRSPQITFIETFSFGATTYATHGVYVYEERMGVSTGEPHQLFQLQNAPILPLEADDSVEIEEKRGDDIVFVKWKQVPDFSKSTIFDRHYTLVLSTGEVAFGPSIRQPDGTTRQYGRIPEAGREVRINRYRYGGGIAGNVPSNQIQVMKKAIPYIDRVVNLIPASNGRDSETMEELMMRARRELRTQGRAVTAEDYELFAKKADRAVARVKANAPDVGTRPIPPGMVELLIIPVAGDTVHELDLSRLGLSDALKNKIRVYVDEYRLVTTTLFVREANYIGIQAEVNVVLENHYDEDVVEERIQTSLRYLITPFLPDNAEPPSYFTMRDWEGWPFGRDLYVAELYSLIQMVPGVKHVLDVKMSQRQVIPDRELPPSAIAVADEEAPENAELTEKQLKERLESESLKRERFVEPLTPVEERMLPVPNDTVLCSLQHKVNFIVL